MRDKDKNRNNQHVWYLKNKLKQIERNKLRRRKVLEAVNLLKLGCIRCNEIHLACLEFHHINREDKERSISRMVQTGCSIDRIKKEIEKCIVLCSNCHKKEHYNNP